jgi:hypothetical protein
MVSSSDITPINSLGYMLANVKPKASDYNNLRTDVINANINTTTRWLSVPAFAFLPFSAETAAGLYIDGYSIRVTTARGTVYLMAQINLPHGAVLSTLTSYYYRNDAGAVVNLGLFYMNPVASPNPIAFINGAGTSWTSTSTGIAGTIDTSNYSYYLRLQISNTVANTAAFMGARIAYTISAALP